MYSENQTIDLNNETQTNLYDISSEDNDETYLDSDESIIYSETSQVQYFHNKYFL